MVVVVIPLPFPCHAIPTRHFPPASVCEKNKRKEEKLYKENWATWSHSPPLEGTLDCPPGRFCNEGKQRGIKQNRKGKAAKDGWKAEGMGP
ncbi:uncharacterized protein BDR25DRAFT_60043 [Lindgomyces ingoldianus]|uniref:Uncharacterized protein n=1 Tax=Lindgomyces ingoldianus TaxID=673940 RepID=A0ACB6QNV6_9PLEO|nr:uncharacterized protein BDR25DRAFT_60043 [Lindgomyces ingoldianus]KAF2467841.1 hypothetical protein BDR25DRAFT_60043 [Lindgomyces ingoldianus]